MTVRTGQKQVTVVLSVTPSRPRERKLARDMSLIGLKGFQDEMIVDAAVLRGSVNGAADIVARHPVGERRYRSAALAISATERGDGISKGLERWYR